MLPTEPPLFDLSDQVAIAVIAGLVALVSGMLAAIIPLYVRVAKIENYNKRLWAYCRGLLDLYYRHRKDGAPDPAPLPDDDDD